MVRSRHWQNNVLFFALQNMATLMYNIFLVLLVTLIDKYKYRNVLICFQEYRSFNLTYLCYEKHFVQSVYLDSQVISA